MLSESEWKQWMEEYPVKEVDELPESYEFNSDERPDAESVADKLEVYLDTSCEVVKFKERFYVVRKY